MKFVEPNSLPGRASARRSRQRRSVKVDLGLGYSDEIESAADAQHRESLLGHHLSPTKSKRDRLLATEEPRTASTGLFFVESITSVAPNCLGSLQSFWLDVDNHDS